MLYENTDLRIEGDVIVGRSCIKKNLHDTDFILQQFRDLMNISILC